MLMEKRELQFQSILDSSISKATARDAKVESAITLVGYDPFPRRPLSGDEVDEWFTDREDDLAAMFRVSALARRLESARFSLIGPPGIGKTSVVSAMQRGFDTGHPDLEQLTGPDFHLRQEPFDLLLPGIEDSEADDEGRDPLVRFVDSLHPKTDLLVLDDSHLHWTSVSRVLRRLQHYSPSLSVLVVLTVSSWHRLVRETDFLESLTTSHLVRPMPLDQLVSLLVARLKDPGLFTDAALNRLSKAAWGVPGVAVHLARRCLLLLKQRGLSAIDEELAEEAISGTPNVERAEAVRKKLTRTESEISQILLEDWDGVTAEVLADRMGIDRSTAVGHLTTMHQKGAVTRSRYGRRVRYEIDPGLRIRFELEMIRTARWDQHAVSAV